MVPGGNLREGSVRLRTNLKPHQSGASQRERVTVMMPVGMRWSVRRHSVCTSLQRLLHLPLVVTVATSG